MKISQDNPTEFQPLTIVLETAAEAEALYNIMSDVDITGAIDYDDELMHKMLDLRSAVYFSYTDN